MKVRERSFETGATAGIADAIGSASARGFEVMVKALSCEEVHTFDAIGSGRGLCRH